MSLHRRISELEQRTVAARPTFNPIIIGRQPTPEDYAAATAAGLVLVVLPDNGRGTATTPTTEGNR
jgi:hypothetical protein